MTTFGLPFHQRAQLKYERKARVKRINYVAETIKFLENHVAGNSHVVTIITYVVFEGRSVLSDRILMIGIRS